MKRDVLIYSPESNFGKQIIVNPQGGIRFGDTPNDQAVSPREVKAVAQAVSLAVSMGKIGMDFTVGVLDHPQAVVDLYRNLDVRRLRNIV